MRVRFRIIVLNINAIEHAEQIVLPSGQQAVQAFAEVGRLDFPGVGGADGVDPVGHDHAGLEEVRLAEALHQAEAAVRDRQEVLHEAEAADAEAKRNNLLANFDDLAGIEAFENLRANCANYDLETLEEKCYAIRGKNGFVAKFSAGEISPKIMVVKTESEYSPYGDLFDRYGVGSKN